MANKKVKNANQLQYLREIGKYKPKRKEEKPAVNLEPLFRQIRQQRKGGR
jgi:hypothetical protein